jgi:hypothetical protein
MKRRTFVVSAVGASIGLAGCSAVPGNDLVPSSDSGDESAETPTSNDDTGSQNVSRETSGPNESESGSMSTPSEEVGTTEQEETTDVELEKNEPTEVVKTFYDALYAPDVETANELIHPDSPETLYSKDAVSRFEGTSHSLEDVEVVEEDGGTAMVEFVLVLVDSEDEERRTDMRVELRMDGEDWKVWEAK